MQGKLPLRVHTEREFAVHAHSNESCRTRPWTQSNESIILNVNKP